MKCDICGYSEERLLESRNAAIAALQQRKDELEKEINSQKLAFADKNGFSEHIKGLVHQIREEYRGFSIEAFLENHASMIKLEGNLEHIYKYLESNKKDLVSKAMLFGQSPNKKVGDIIDEFMKEPIESRFSKEYLALIKEKDEIERAKCKLGSINTFFVEKQFGPETIGIDKGTVYLLRKMEIANDLIIRTVSIKLCPYCASMFKESASAAFETIKIAQAQLDDDDD